MTTFSEKESHSRIQKMGLGVANFICNAATKIEKSPVKVNITRLLNNAR